jgi:hypothetical protein
MNIVVQVSTSRVVRGVQKYEAAREAVTPYIGDPGYAFDSADALYKHALKQLGHDVTEIKAEGVATALWPALRNRKAARSRAMATDAKTLTDRNQMFPNAGRLLNPFG